MPHPANNGPANNDATSMDTPAAKATPAAEAAEAAAATAEASAEMLIGSYRITATLGEGGMGMVYAAQHKLLGRPAAIKVLRPQYSSHPQVVERFFNEARAAAAAKNPGIVEIYDFGHQDDGSAFIAMELLEGEDLEARLRRLHRVSLPQALLFTSQIASALAAAHGHGITHRDLKPANVFIVTDPQVVGGERIKLLDFGIAKVSMANAEGEVNQTRADAVMGTPSYMAPEQCRGSANVDGRADLYSAGCILFEMLCGRPPFIGATSVDIMSAHLRDQPPRPSEIEPSLGPELDALILSLLAKKPEERFQRAVDLERALHMLLSGDLAGVVAQAGAMTQLGDARDMGLLDGGAPWYRRLAIPLALIATMAVAGAVFALVQRGGGSAAAPAPPGPAVIKQTIVKPAAPIEPPRFFQLGANPDGDEGDLPAEVAAADSDATKVVWRITSTPPGARVLYRDEPVGTTDTTLAVIVPRDPDRSERLVLDKFGYVPQVVTFSAGEDLDWEVEMHEEVELAFRSTPKGAVIYDREGKGYGRTPGMVAVPPGDEPLTFVLELEGYADEQVEVIPDEDKTTRVDLTPLVTVRIESEPAGAAVWRGGERLGVTPLDDRVRRGRDPIEYDIKREGYEDERITLRPRRDSEERVKLEEQKE